jgi:hypothetical protein
MKGLVGTVTERLQEHASVVGAVAAVALVVALYAHSVTFGLFGDDPSGHFRFMESVSWPEMFTSSPGFFMRPLVFVIIKLLWLMQGGYGAAGFHMVPVGLHVANTLLVGVFATSLSRRRSYGWLAALLFATFPLSPEAVAEFDSFCHPLVTFWCLLSLVLFQRGRRSANKHYLWAVYPCVVLALLSHENGLLVPVLLLSFELIYYPPASPRHLLRMSAVPYFVLPALYMLWWLQIPKDPTTVPHNLVAVLRNTLPFQQVAAYPLLPMIRLQVTDWMPLLALVGLTLLVTFVATRSLGMLRLWLFAVIWMIVAAVPSVLFLDWDYLHGGPRLYYMASVGAALLWASPPVALINLAGKTVARRAVFIGTGALLALALLLPPVPFINCHMDLVDQVTRLVRLISAQATSTQAGRDLVFVNLPGFITSNAEHPRGCPSTYPFVTTGVGVFPPYAELRDFVRVNGGPDRPARGVAVTAYDSNWPPRYGEALPLSALRDTLQQNQVYVFEIANWSVRDLSKVWRPGASQIAKPQVTFGDLLGLQSSTVQRAGSDLVVTLLWQVHTAPPLPLTAFVHVYDRTGRLLAQHDGTPGQNGAPSIYAPLALWQAGDVIQDVHTISLSTPLPSEGYTVAVGLYDPATVKRLQARGPDGTEFRDDLYVLAQ